MVTDAVSAIPWARGVGGRFEAPTTRADRPVPGRPGHAFGAAAVIQVCSAHIMYYLDKLKTCP